MRSFLSARRRSNNSASLTALRMVNNSLTRQSSRPVQSRSARCTTLWVALLILKSSRLRRELSVAGRAGSRNPKRERAPWVKLEKRRVSRPPDGRVTGAERKSRDQILSEMHGRATAARIVILNAIQSPAVAEALAEWALTSYVLSLQPVGGSLADSASFRPMPESRADVPGSDTVSVAGPRGPRTIAVGEFHGG